MSTCRGEWDLGLCTFPGLGLCTHTHAHTHTHPGLAKRMRLCTADEFCGQHVLNSEVGTAQPNSFRKYLRKCVCVSVCVSEKCTDLDLKLLYVWTLGTYTKFAWNNNMVPLGVGFPQACWSAGCTFAASRWRVDSLWSIASVAHQPIWCLVNLIPLISLIRGFQVRGFQVRSRDTQPYLKAPLLPCTLDSTHMAWLPWVGSLIL